jgi:hypothetical protein
MKKEESIGVPPHQKALFLNRYGGMIMREDKKPTIQIKTASPACPDLVGNWAMGQKNPNESVKYLIIQMAAYFGNVDIFDPNIISTLNSMLSHKKVERMQPSIIKEYKARTNDKEETAATETKMKKKIDARPKTEPIGNMDIFDPKFMNELNSMFNQSGGGETKLSTIKEKSAKPNVEKEKTETTPEEAEAASAVKEGKEKKVKKKVGARPGTAPNIMQ